MFASLVHIRTITPPNFFKGAAEKGFIQEDQIDGFKERMEKDKYFKKHIINSVLNKKLIEYIKENHNEL